MKFKKLVSGLLACAMVVTSVFTGNVTTAKAEGPAVRTVTPEDALATYNFDGSLGDGLLWQKGMTAYSGDAVYEQGKSDFPEDKAIRTQAKYGVKLSPTNLGQDYTVSFWVKSNVASIEENHNILSLGNHSPEKWLGLAGNKKNTSDVKLWSKVDANTGSSVTYSHTKFAFPTFPQGEWKMVTLAQSGTDLSFYINGKLQTLSVNSGVGEILDGANAAIYLAANYWDSTVDASFDDAVVYKKKLDAPHIQALYLDQMPFKNFGALAEGDSVLSVSKDLSLPENYDGIALTWTSKNQDKIGNDGEVKVLDGSIVELTASGTLEGGATWSHDYKVQLAKTITVEYVKKGETTPLKTKEVAYKVADSYTYTPTEEDKVWTNTDGKTYVLSETEGDNTLTTSGANPKFTLTYNEDVVTEIVTTVEPKITRIGLKPDLPTTVQAKFTSGATRTVTVDWSGVPANAYDEAGETEVVGKVGTKDLKVKVTVEDKEDYLIADYSFDKGSDGLKDAVSGGAATKYGDVTMEEGLKGNAAYFPGGDNGTSYLELPDELLQVPGSTEGSTENAKDITISLFTKKSVTVNSFAMALLANTAGGNGQNYIGLINHSELRAEVKSNGGAHLQATATAAQVPPEDEWDHFAIVVSSTDTTLRLYKNGVLMNTKKDAGIDIANFTDDDLKNYLGYSPWSADSDYAGAIDEFKIYNTILDQSEIKTICDETLYDGQMAKTKAALETLKTVDDVEVDENTALVDDLQLPTEGPGYDSVITWTSSNTDVIAVNAETGEGFVTQPTDSNAEVTLTAVIKIGKYEETETLTYKVNVPKREGVDKGALRRAIRQANKALAALKEEGIYNAESLGEFQKAITDATAKLDDATMTEDQVAEEVAKLEAAAAKKYALKDLEELEDVLTGWYPLNTDAKDSSFMHADGEAAENVEFSKKDGATFKGGTALQNIIKLPADKLKITDRMTISMQVYPKTANQNVIGIGSVANETGSTARQFAVTTHDKVQVFVTSKGWQLGGRLGYDNLPFDLNKWHDLTAVIDGKKITLYLDGKKYDPVNTGITMTDAWNHGDGETRFAYIGNCAYGHNNDGDFNGSIKDFRIYNAALTETQVGYIDEYRSNLDMVYAKEDLVDKMSKDPFKAVAQDDGTYTMNVTQREAAGGKLALPRECFGQTVTWTSDNEAIVIGDTDTTVTIPAAGEEDVEVTLTASITIDEKTETVTYNCTLFTRNENVDTTALKDYIDEVKVGKVKENYTANSWSAYQNALNAAVKEEARPTSTDTVATKKSDLETAVNDLVDISELRAKVTQIQREKNSLDEEQELYTSDSWEALQAKLDAANAVVGKADATKQEVADKLATLPETALAALVECGDRSGLDAAIATAEGLEDYENQYTPDSWRALQTALATAKEEQAKRLADYTSATTALQAKIDALEVKPEFILSGAEKTAMQGKLDAAKAEAEERVAANYTDASWAAYQNALTKLENILALDNATKVAANDALAALEAATAALTPVSSQEPTKAVRDNLADAIAGAKDKTFYTDESWAEYQAALDKLKALKKTLDDADEEETTTNITKYEIEKAIEALNTAVGKLVPKAEYAVGEAETAAMAAAVAEAGTRKKANYTNESWTVFQEKLTALKAMQTNESATKAEAQAAIKDLEDAMDGLVPTAKQTPSEEDVKGLTDAYKAATDAALKEADYTAESWAAYQEAYAAMGKIADRLADDKKKGSVTKTEIETAVKNLNTATEGLVRNVDKTALDAAIAGCANLKEADYTAATWSAFQTALNAAKAVSAKEDATQKDVDDALTELNAKKAALAKAVATNPVLVNSIKLSATYTQVAAGKKTTVKATVNSNATVQGVTFTSSNTKWATVNPTTGVVTTKKAGGGKTVTITATANDAGKKTQTIKIKIMQNAVTKITVKKKTVSVKAGKKTTIKTTVKTNGKKANKKLEWKSSNTKWATVKNGKVTTKKAGKGKTVKITASSTDGTNKKVTVKVKITK